MRYLRLFMIATFIGFGVTGQVAGQNSLTPPPIPEGARPGDANVFGLQLGQPLSLPQCALTKNGKDSYSYDYGLAKQWCYKPALMGLEQPKPDIPRMKDGDIDIEFPFEQRPALTIRPLSGMLLDGNLEKIEFVTGGIEDQDKVLEGLVQKYGAPHDREDVQLQTKVGAKFSAIRVVWVFSNLVVYFDSAPHSIDAGRVMIETPKAVDVDAAKAKRVQQGVRPL